MRFLYIFILGSVLMFSCNSSRVVTSQIHSWTDVAVIDGIEMYVDTSNIETKDGLTYAWVKTTYTSEENRGIYTDRIRNTFKNLSEDKLNSKMAKWAGFYYNVSYCAFDCMNKRYKVLEVTDYTSDNRKIVTTHPPKNKEQWLNVGVDTMGDYTLFYICDYGN